MPKKWDLYLIYKHTDNLKLGNYYKTYCKILAEVIKTAKNLHFNHLLKHSSNKTKTMWNLVKSEINKQETSDSFLPYMEGKLVKDHHDLVNRFNEYFINVTTNAYANTKTGNLPAINNLYSVYRQSFPQIQMAPVTTKEIKETIKSLPWKNSSGYDEIPLRILKISMPLFTSPLTYLCNKSICKGSFPTRLKYSQITPIFKKRC